MTPRFNILFTIDINHAYYTSTCEDFDFIVPSDTASLLKNGKLITKIRDGKLFVMFEADESNVPIKPITGKMLRIGLRLNNPFFSNFTKPGIDISLTSLYRNLAVNTKLDNVVGIPMIGNIFSHTITKTPRLVTVTINDRNGNPLQSEVITSAENRLSVAFDLSNKDAGIYQVVEAYSGDTQYINYYADSELQAGNIFGIIEVAIDGSFYTTPPEFEVKFDAKPETQKYYIVAKNFSDADFDLLSVSDNGFASDGRSQIIFTKVPKASFVLNNVNPLLNDIDPSLLGDSSSKIVMFKSQALVTRSEKARKNIQLAKNGDLIIKHLPQPAVEKNNADMIIQISKP